MQPAVPDAGRTFQHQVDQSANGEFMLPTGDANLQHVRPGLSVIQSIIGGKNVGVGIKTRVGIPTNSFVSVFTGVWAYNDDVDASVLRGAACVRRYAAGFGDLDTYVVDGASVEERGLLRSEAHRIMCLVRHDRAGSEAAGCVRVRYDPSDASMPSDVGGLFNHANSNEWECNCVCQPCIVSSADGMRLALIVCTTRNVRAGEELRWDYGWDSLENDDDGSRDEVEFALPFSLTRDTTWWSAPLTNPPQPDLDSYQIDGHNLMRDWSIQNHGNDAVLFRPEWCGPHVHLRSVPSGLAAAVVVWPPSGDDYRRRLPDMVTR